MRWTKANIIFLILVGLYLLLVTAYMSPDLAMLQKGIDEYHVAVVSSPDTPEVEQAVQLYLDDYNYHALEKGRRITLDTYHDDGSPESATRIAESIAASKAVAVLGHPGSTSSLIAGDIYQKHEIPAISVQATNYAVTRSNPWYFRTVFNDRDQGVLLTNYMHHVLNAEQIYLIHSADAYGEYLADMVQKVSNANDIEIIASTRLLQGQQMDPEEAIKPLLDHRERQRKALAKARKKYEQNLARNPDDDNEEPVEAKIVVFLAVSSEQGLSLITTLRDSGIAAPIVGTETLSANSFTRAITTLPRELAQPGYYTQNLYFTTPFSFELANREAQQFKHRFRKHYQGIPAWQAMYAYDAIKIIGTGIDKLVEAESTPTLHEQRKQLRLFLAGINTPDKAIAGVTGSNWFDSGGDVSQSITVLGFQRGHISVAPLQIYPEPDPFDRHQTTRRWLSDAIGGGNDVVRTRHVIYTSVRVNHIDNIDMNQLEYDMEFDVWFRGSESIDEDDIELINSVDDTTLGYAVQSSSSGDIHYTLFSVKGRFKADFQPNRYRYGSHIVGLQFQHKGLDAHNLNFVTDYRGMGMVGPQEGRPVLERMLNERVVAADSGWIQTDLYIYHDRAGRHSLGEPTRISRTGGYLEHSRFNVEAVISPDGLNIYNLLSEENAAPMIVILLGLVLLSAWLLVRYRYGWLNRILWITQVLQLVALVVAIQVLVISEANAYLQGFQVRPLAVMFDVVWWLFAAIMLDMMIRHFLWRTLEESTEQTIPVLVKNFTSFIIFSLALLGVIAFVFDQKVTSLLATSGVLAMIIGLAIQMNIANIFSGIALNLEAPFRPGDWVRIGDFPEARVFDITWRATRLITRDEHLLCIPNHLAAESTIHNYSQPEQGPTQQLELLIPANANPSRVRKLLLDALLSTLDVASTPKARVVFTGINEECAGYRLQFHLSDYHKRGSALDSVWERIWIHLRRSELPSPINVDNPLLADGIRTDEEAVFDAVCQMDLFSSLTEEERLSLAASLKIINAAAGTNIVEVGAPSESMFLIVEGATRVLVPDAQGRMLEARRLGVGDYFGEIGLRRNSPRTATVSALSDTRLVEMPREQVLPLLEKSPEMPDLLEAVVNQRARETEKLATIETVVEAPRPLIIRLLSKLLGLRKRSSKRNTS